jgi:hypothetical protein
MSDQKAETRLHWTLVNGAHLTVLCAFALAQPLFDILGQNPEFFAVRGSTATQIVAFALVVLLALPLVLTAIEAAVSFASRTAAQTLHLVFVACLTAVVALYLVTKADSLYGLPALLVAGLLGVIATLVYARVRALRTFLTVLVPAPFVFLALFLLSSPVSDLVFVEEAEAKVAAIDSTTPVVVLLFDEFPTASLMDRDNRIDRERWPNFASLASQSVWFRNATTVHSHTVGAVPAVLTGRRTARGKLPVYADHPESLYTFLAGSHEMKVIEVLRLCPPTLCQNSRASQQDPTPGPDTASLASDAGVVYLHLLLPDPYAADLPPVGNTWGDFGERGLELALRTFDTPQQTVPPCAYNICRFANRINADDKPALYFLHESLPHGSWRFLPSGKRYDGNVQAVPGEGATWTNDSWLTTQAQQRYLLQVGYTDRALGVVLNRLRETGIYDKALVVVTADHGESFLPGMPRRHVREGNLADIAFMPLFVKLPGQTTPRTDDSFARTIDILPTIAHALGAQLPWPVDGRSLLDRPPAEGMVRVVGPTGNVVSAPLREVRRQRARGLKNQHAVFGTGRIQRVYRIGPNKQLLGGKVADLDVRPSREAEVELDGGKLLDVVDLATDVIPNYITGQLRDTQRKRENLAISVNGTIRAVTRSYAEFEETKFAALVPEESLRGGSNSVSVFVVRRTASGLVLEELRQSKLAFRLVGGSRPAIKAPGVTIKVDPGALAGEVKLVWGNGLGSFTGWAGDLAARRRVDRILVFVNGRSVYVGHPGKSRSDIRARYYISKAGFVFRLPQSVVPKPGGGHDVRVFAVLGRTASELRYIGGNPWKR